MNEQATKASSSATAIKPAAGTANAAKSEKPAVSPLAATPIGRLVKFPLQRVHVELTNACNFDCTFCPKNVMTRPYGFMDKELAKKIVNQIKENNIAEKVTFHIMGEPFMHRDFYEILAHCRDIGQSTGITCNGSYLSAETAEKIAPLNVGQMNISLQTPDEVSFESRKAKKSLGYHPYEKNILEFVAGLRKQGSNTTVKIHFLNTRFGTTVKDAIGGLDVIGTTDELRAVLKSWITKIYALDYYKEMTAERDRAISSADKVVSYKWNVLEIAPGVHLETYILDNWGNAFGDGAKFDANYGYCTAMQDHFGILYTGQMVLCCKDFDGKTVMGDAKTTPLTELLNSPAVLDIVNGFNAYKVKHPHCKKCLGGKSRLDSLKSVLGSIFFFRLLKNFFYNKQKVY